jgi:hypothetical protein
VSDEPTLHSLPWHRTRGGQTLLVVLGLAGLYALVEHWAHAAPFLPWLLILGCPLAHLFMHRGHGSLGGHGGPGRQDDGPERPSGGKKDA